VPDAIYALLMSYVKQLTRSRPTADTILTTGRRGDDRAACQAGAQAQTIRTMTRAMQMVGAMEARQGFSSRR